MGIDPGSSSGGIAVIGGPEGPQAWPIGKLTEREVWLLVRDIAPEIELCCLEKVHAMPKQGVTSSFKFGVSYGALRMLCAAAGIPTEDVTPARWQKALGCLSGGDKNVTKARAQSLFPQLKIIHATADALLLAEYARRIRATGKGEPVTLGTPEKENAAAETLRDTDASLPCLTCFDDALLPVERR